MTLPGMRGRSAWPRRARSAWLVLVLAGAAAVAAQRTLLPGAVSPPSPPAQARVQAASDIVGAQPGPAAAPLRAMQRARPDGGRSDRRVLMLMLLGRVAGSAGPFGRLGQ